MLVGKIHPEFTETLTSHSSPQKGLGVMSSPGPSALPAFQNAAFLLYPLTGARPLRICKAYISLGYTWKGGLKEEKGREKPTLSSKLGFAAVIHAASFTKKKLGNLDRWSIILILNLKYIAINRDYFAHLHMTVSQFYFSNNFWFYIIYSYTGILSDMKILMRPAHKYFWLNASPSISITSSVFQCNWQCTAWWSSWDSNR